jgi:hypothetical protein
VLTELSLPLSDLVYWDRVQLQCVSLGVSGLQIKHVQDR